MKNAKGFTILEVLIAGAIMVGVGLFASQFMSKSTKQYQISVCIKFSSVSDSEVTFSHPEFLKLPQYGQKLYKLDITGEAVSSGRKLIKKITVFKR